MKSISDINNQVQYPQGEHDVFVEAIATYLTTLVGPGDDLEVTKKAINQNVEDLIATMKQNRVRFHTQYIP